MRQLTRALTTWLWCLATLVFGATCSHLGALSKPEMLQLAGDMRVHDPAIIRQGNTFYVFSTGGRPPRGIIYMRCSNDLYNWTRCGSVFKDLPKWAKREIPRARSAWAPDISFFNGKYHLYYSVSTFGTNNSAIGVATNQNLD